MSKFSRIAAVLGISLSAIVMAGAARAATATATFNVTATVNATCTISAANLNFGTYSPASGSPTVGSTNLTAQCTNGTPYQISLSAGTTKGATIGTRLMTNGTSTLSYNLFTNSSDTTIFGDGTTSGSTTASGTGNGNAQTIPVYGAIPAGQFVSPGSYSDSITATISY